MHIVYINTKMKRTPIIMLLLLITYATIGAVNKMSLKYIATTAYQKQLP